MLICSSPFLIRQPAPKKNKECSADQKVDKQAQIDGWQGMSNSMPQRGRKDRHDGKVDQVADDHRRQRPLEVRERHAYFF